MEENKFTGNWKRLLTTREAAVYLGIGISTLEQSRVTGKFGIPYVKLGSRAIRYRIEDLDNYLSSLATYTSTSAIKTGGAS